MMLHVFVTICFLSGAGDLSGRCLDEKPDPTAITFSDAEGCKNFINDLGAENMVVRKGVIEFRFRCAGET